MKEFLISNLLSNLTHDGAYSPRNFTDKGKIVANIKIQTNFNLVSLAQIKCLIAFSMQVPADWGGGGVVPHTNGWNIELKWECLALQWESLDFQPLNIKSLLKTFSI